MKSLKRRVYEANMELAARNLVIYTWGNVSAIDRKRHRVYIKPRGIEYKHLTEDDIVTVDPDGKLIDGSFMPSVDLDIHLAIYRNFGKITGVAHTHSTCATAWAQACREIPVLGTTHADHFYGSIPCTLPLSKEEIERNYEGNIGKSIVEKFRNLDPIRIQAVLVAKHGPITWGDGPEQAVENSVILEEIADLAKRTLMISPETEEIEKHLMEKHFLRKWGPDADFYQKKTTSVGIKQNSVPYKKP